MVVEPAAEALAAVVEPVAALVLRGAAARRRRGRRAPAVVEPPPVAVRVVVVSVGRPLPLHATHRGGAKSDGPTLPLVGFGEDGGGRRSGEIREERRVSV